MICRRFRHDADYAAARSRRAITPSTPDATPHARCKRRHAAAQQRRSSAMRSWHALRVRGAGRVSAGALRARKMHCSMARTAGCAQRHTAISRVTRARDARTAAAAFSILLITIAERLLRPAFFDTPVFDYFPILLMPTLLCAAILPIAPATPYATLLR